MFRKPPIANTLVKNSISAVFAGIEIHNKPIFPFRYEVVVLLFINAWELLLKAYIYKYLPHVALFKKDGNTKPFSECVSCVFSNLDKNYYPLRENLEKLYQYRTTIAHFYTKQLDILIFALLKKNLIEYKNFLQKFFKKDISDKSNLVLLPIGFSKPLSPIDYLSNASKSTTIPQDIKDYIQSIMESTRKLNDEGIDDSILIDFRLNLTNEKRVKNADIIAGITKSSNTNGTIVIDDTKKVRVTSSFKAQEIRVSRNKSLTNGTLYYEELDENIFKEINNIIQANQILSENKSEFILREEMYYRIYAARSHVDNKKEYFDLLARASLNDFNAPGLFWIKNIDIDSLSNLIVENIIDMKSPRIQSLFKLATLLGDNVLDWVSGILNDKFGNQTQPPEYYWTLSKIISRKGESDTRLRALRSSKSKKIEIKELNVIHTLETLIQNNELAVDLLSQVVTLVSSGVKELRPTGRELDIIAYGNQIEKFGEDLLSQLPTTDKIIKLITL